MCAQLNTNYKGAPCFMELSNKFSVQFALRVPWVLLLECNLGIEMNGGHTEYCFYWIIKTTEYFASILKIHELLIKSNRNYLRPIIITSSYYLKWFNFFFFANGILGELIYVSSNINLILKDSNFLLIGFAADSLQENSYRSLRVF